jgi:hypothetical protein
MDEGSLTEFIERWKTAIGNKDKDEIDKIYDELDTIAESFSVDFMK